jgi:hypothetical protein
VRASPAPGASHAVNVSFAHTVRDAFHAGRCALVDSVARADPDDQPDPEDSVTVWQPNICSESGPDPHSQSVAGSFG